MLSPFGFRIRALVPRNRLPATEVDLPIVLPVGDRVVTIAIQAGTAGRADHLILRSTGFATENAALVAGLEAKAALRATGVSMNVPMDLGPDTASTGIGQVVKDSVREQFNVELRGDVHGLDIFDDGEAEVRHLRIEAEGSVIANREQFVENLALFLEGAQEGEIDGRVQLAADVYMGAAFESSDRARFVAYITVLEILADRKPRTSTAVSLIDDWMTEVRKNEDIVETEAASLIGALRDLKEESIGASIRNMVASFEETGHGSGDRGGTAFIKACYAARSKLVHDGVIPRGFDIRGETPKLAALVRELLLDRLG